MRDLITELAKDYLVVIDAPPALPVTDAMILAQRVDGMLVVTSMGTSRKEHLRRVLQLAQNVNARVFGIVLNNIPQGRSAGVYGYETYGYYGTDKGGHRRRRRRRPGSAPSRRATEPAEPVVPAQPLQDDDGAWPPDLDVPVGRTSAEG
jgi:Mrp family chromosome partitioning ATPase